MKTWEKGPPTSKGLFVIEWMNGGGYAVYDVHDHDGILFAYTCEGMNQERCTRLSKWAIKRHLRIENPDIEALEVAWSARIAVEQPASRPKKKHK